MGEIRMQVRRLRKIAGRWFWRPSKSLKAKGFRSVPLGADPLVAIEKARRLNARVERDRQSKPGPRFEPGSIGDMIKVYTADARFTRLAPATQRAYRFALTEIEAEVGDLAIAELERPALRAIYRKIRERGDGIARLHMAVWGVLMDLAMDEGWRTTNPAREMRIARGESRSRVWTAAELERFRAAAADAGKPSIALAIDLAYETGQRPGDVLQLTWSQWDGRRFTLTQTKRKARVVAPVGAELRDRLNAMSRDGVQIVLQEATKRPYSPASFRGHFSRLRKAAGLSADLQARDMRRTALTELGESGATDEEIRSISGHRDRQMVAIYVKPSPTMAEAGSRKREHWRNRSGKIATKDPK